MVGGGDIVYKELSYAVIGCAQRVHTKLGPGFPEYVYQRALGVELTRSRIPFQPQAPFMVVHEGNPCGLFRVDILVDEKIVLELKAVAELAKVHAAQAYSYLRASGAQLAILINFGELRLVSQRIVMSRPLAGGTDIASDDHAGADA